MLITTIMKMSVMIGIGALIANFVAITPDIRKFTVTIIINVALPCLILNGIFQLKIDHELMIQIIQIFLISILLHGFGILLGWFAVKLFKRKTVEVREIAILSTFGNAGFFGIPLCATLYGPKGALFASVFDAGMALILWSAGVMLLQNNKAIKLANLKPVINMPVIAVLIGLFVTSFKMTPPDFIKDLTKSLANVATPFAMIYIGLLLMSIIKNRKRFPALRIMLPITIKLIVLPLIVLTFIILFSFHKDLSQVFLIQSALPNIATASILFARYNANEEFGVMATLCSTLLSLVTIPIVVYIGGLIVN